MRTCTWLLCATACAWAAAAQPESMLPVTTPPIIYTIDYSGDYFTDPSYIERFRAAPPDLLHVGKAVPISHHWGPTRMYQGENQSTGGPNNTLNWDNIALISPEQLAERIENIRRTTARYHAIGISEITPYISFHTLAGDHQKRLGFWNFYDHWDQYARWAGPKPAHDPFDWLVVDRQGQFVGGSCGGYSPDYYAPLHRYRACIRHPDWAEWERRLIRMVAEAGYDGCFVDNASTPDDCYCRYCKEAFVKFLRERRDLAWVGRLAEGLDLEKLALDSPDVPPELVRRFRLLYLRDYLAMLREVGRQVNPRFTIFPNGNSLQNCLVTGSTTDRLMLESSYSPGIMTASEPPESGQIAIQATAEPVKPEMTTHRFDLDDASKWIELEAEVALPEEVQVGKPVSLPVRILTVGGSMQDNDAAEDFHLVLRDSDRREQVRLALEPKAILGASSPNGKGTRPPSALKAVWTPERPGRYTVSLGCTYTDSGHISLYRHMVPLAESKVCLTHIASQVFAQQMRARMIYLGYDGRRAGWENVQELSLAEMAAFSGGGGFSGQGAPQAKYRTFFKKYPLLFAGWQMTAPAAVLYAEWGNNPLAHVRPVTQPTIQEYLAETHRPYVSLVDASLPETAEPLRQFEAIYLQSAGYEMSDAQVAALRAYADRGGQIVVSDEKITINGKPAAEILSPATVAPWNWEKPRAITRPLEQEARGRHRNVRFAVYGQDGRLALHAVNYNVCLLDKAKQILDVEPTEVRLALPPGWSAVRATCFDPDAEPQGVAATVADGNAVVALPKLHVYKVVLIEKVEPRSQGRVDHE